MDESISTKDIAEIIESDKSNGAVENKAKFLHPLEIKDVITISN